MVLSMKVLRIKALGIPLFKEELDISFFGKQRTSEDVKKYMYKISSNIYMNCAQAFIGKNASGKTSVLQVISLALNILNNEPINHIPSKYILGNTKEAIFYIYFYSEKEGICCLKTVITPEKNINEERIYRIVSEELWKKSLDKVKTKKQLTDFNGLKPVEKRNGSEKYLSNDVSMIIAQNRKNNEHIAIANLFSFTNTNTLPLTDQIPESIITFLDPTVESLYLEHNENKSLIHLKFKGSKEMLLNSAAELELYLSSGTIKGITTFMYAINVMEKGGYLLIDELENHFNKEIVSTIIRFFMDSKLNKNGGTLIYTTHYPELLDEYERNDSIFITQNKNGIIVQNLADLLKRNDVKKSEAYQSGLIAETSPQYEAYLSLKKYISSSINNRGIE